MLTRIGFALYLILTVLWPIPVVGVLVWYALGGITSRELFQLSTVAGCAYAALLVLAAALPKLEERLKERLKVEPDDDREAGAK